MKTNILLATTFFCFAYAGFARVAPERIGNPNTITCSSVKGDLTVSLTLGSVKPLNMTVTKKRTLGSDSTLKLASLSATNTGVGTLFAGFNPYIADANDEYTLIVPNVLVNLDSEEKVEFDSVFVESFSGGLIRDPRPGAQISNTYTDVSCSAQFLYMD